MSDRRVDGFFYGLFMDNAVLRDSGVTPAHARRAYVDGYALRIGRRATLIPAADARAYGMVLALTHDELDRLYTAPGLEAYRPEAVIAYALDGDCSWPALCYNLRVAPAPGESNNSYAAQLRDALTRLKFPADYIESVS